MNIRLLIDSIVRQTTVLVAQLATSGGVRAPLAHVANQVFLDLAKELDSQGLSRKVSADMFGMALRAYQRKLQRLTESRTDAGHSLWEAILSYISERKIAMRTDVLTRFKRDDEALVRGVLHDLTDSGLIFRSGSGANAVYRVASEDELGLLNRLNSNDGLESFLWAVIYRDGPIAETALAELVKMKTEEIEPLLRRLTSDGRIRMIKQGDKPLYESISFFVPLNAPLGWEAAIFDHYRAVVQTICQRLRCDRSTASEDDTIGGSTYTLDIWQGHPFEHEARGVLHDFRKRLSALRAQIKIYNNANPIPKQVDQVVVYAGQCVIPIDPITEEGA